MEGRRGNDAEAAGVADEKDDGETGSKVGADDGDPEANVGAEMDIRMAGKAGAEAGGTKRVRPTGRKNRAWFKYCKSLPTHLKSQHGGDEVNDRQEGVASGGTSFRASDPSRDDQGRRVGLPEHERCSVWLTQKKRLCSQRRAPDHVWCLSHIQNPPSELQLAGGSAAAASSFFSPSPAASSAPSMLTCPSCGAVVAAAKLEKHKGRCNVLRREAEQEAQPYFLHHANSGIGFPGEETQKANEPGGILAGLGEQDFAALILKTFDQHVPPLEEEVLEAKGCEALFAASLAGGKERQDKQGSLYKHLLQDSSIIAHAQRSGLLSESPTTQNEGDDSRADGSQIKRLAGKVFVEFGAGKGMLSLAVVHCVPGAQVALVDREQGASRSKTDRMITSCGGHVTRLTIDIRHLHLAGSGWGCHRPVVAVSKHLCGYS